MKLPYISKIKLPKFNLKNRIILIAVISVLFLIWLWWFGSDFTFFGYKPFESTLTRWVITFLLLVSELVIAIAMLYRRLMKLTVDKKQVKQENRDPVQVKIHQQQNYLSRWLLNYQRLAGKGSSATDKMPCYIIVGAQSSGKSSLLKENCKLNQLHQTEFDGKIHCWLSNQAILIDVDGLLFDQPNTDDMPHLNAKLWQHLLNWLLEHRTKQPLNGIVLTIDIYHLATCDKTEKENYLHNIKERINEITSTTHCKLPVYIVFTKLDLLYGFEAMYQSLTKEQRHQVLGVTFSDAEITWQEALKNFWQDWVSRMNHAIPNMMVNNVDISQRSQLFTFVRQIHGLHDAITKFIDDGLFGLNNQYIQLRGIYFTSSIQKGQMDDLFVKSASLQYNLPEQIYPSWQLSQSHTYFSYNLVNHLLFSETRLASENLRNKQKQTQRNYIAGTVCAASIIGVFIGWQYYYSLNYRSGNDVLIKLEQFQGITRSNQKDFFGDLQLPLLNPIGQATAAYGDYHQRSRLLSDLGLYQGYKIAPHVEKTYLNLLLQRFLPSIMNGLQYELDKAPKGSEEKLRILRIMRMIEDESGRDKKIVMQFMAERWSHQFKGQAEVQDQLARHLSYALDHIHWRSERKKGNELAINSYLPFEQSISNAQTDLRRLSIYQRIYQNLRAHAKSILPLDLQVNNHIGANFDTLFSFEHEELLDIPQLLTRNGLINYFVLQDEKLIEMTALDSWVLDITANVKYSEADRQEIQKQITALYLQDYSATWHSAYNNIKIRHFRDISDVINALDQVIGGDYIFKRTLLLLKENTEPKQSFVSDTNATNQIASLLDKRDYQLLNQLSREFKKETSVLNEQDDSVSNLQQVNEKLSDLHRYLLAIQNSPSQGKAALQVVQLRLNNKGSDPILEIRQLAKSLPEPLGRWMNEIANRSWNAIMVEAIKSLEIEWSEKVVAQYNQYLANRYPFNPSSKSDVPLSEFERFFGYNGTLDMFYQQNLKAFIDNNLETPETGDVLIRKDVLEQLELANKIRRTFFTPQGLTIKFLIQPIEMSGNRRRGILNIDGQLVEYKQASSRPVSLIWPNSMRENIESKITLISGQERTAKFISFNGPWGLMRLINSGKLKNIKDDSFEIRYDIDSSYIIYRIYIDESNNPFAGGLFGKFKLPETLY